MKRIPFVLALAAALTACGTFSTTKKPRVPASVSELAGRYDNHEQVWSARAPLGAPHATIEVRDAGRAGWTIWLVRTQGRAAMDATWAMHRIDDGGQAALVPHRPIHAEAGAAKFDPAQWAPLDACVLRGSAAGGTLRVSAEPAACTALVPGIGASAALLPLAIEHEGEWLRVRLYSDQARGPEARIDARRVREFGGWVALNGAGRDARADSVDWHTDEAVRIGSEGGRYALRFRDGQPSGYSLLLERLTYREGREPVLKLSVVEDAAGTTLAYAWADPAATRIGISLGWVQVGLHGDAAR